MAVPWSVWDIFVGEGRMNSGNVIVDSIPF